MAAALTIRATIEHWPIAGKFVISRGARTVATPVVAEISDGTHTGRGECLPYPRYGESVEGVVAAIRSVTLESADRQALREKMPAGAARNAVDCALFDLAAKRGDPRAYEIAGITEMRAVTTAYTLNLGTPDEMAAAARRATAPPSAKAPGMPLLKVKLGGDGDAARISAVRTAVPGTRLIVDANEAWTAQNFAENIAACKKAGVELIEQPLAAGADDLLRHVEHPVPICADESFHTTADLPALLGKYDAVNIKLDKTGGLTEALDAFGAARRAGQRIMVGCMVGTSLAIAPAMILAQGADWVDLDGPLLLARDRAPGLRYEGALVHPPSADLWG